MKTRRSFLVVTLSFIICTTLGHAQVISSNSGNLFQWNTYNTLEYKASNTTGGWARYFNFNDVNGHEAGMGTYGTVESGISYLFLDATNSTSYTNTKQLRLYPDGNVVMPNGLLGIGMTSPESKLDVQAISYGNNQEGGINLSSYLNNINRWTTQIELKSNSGGSPRFAITTRQKDGSGTETANNEAISIPLYTGNVGIGNVAPTARLHLGSNTANASNYMILGKRLSTAENNLPFIGHDSHDGNASDLGLGATSTSGGINFYTGNFNNASFAQSRLRMHLDKDGSLGIGTTDPSSILHLYGDLPVLKVQQNPGIAGGGGIELTAAGSSDGANNKAYVKLHNAGAIWGKSGGGGTNRLEFGSPDRLNTYMTIHNGDVGIGTNSPDAKLAVKGRIHTQEVKVDLNGAVAPDYVFLEDYDLKTLQEVEDYIAQEGHLPNIPSAAEMEKEGVYLKEMNLKLLEKVEELTLYTIQQQKELDQQKKYNQNLEQRLKKLEELNNN